VFIGGALYQQDCGMRTQTAGQRAKKRRARDCLRLLIRNPKSAFRNFGGFGLQWAVRTYSRKLTVRAWLCFEA
jgi:hypothetical protein